jgi:hypothetical protein
MLMVWWRFELGRTCTLIVRGCARAALVASLIASRSALRRLLRVRSGELLNQIVKGR